MLLLYILLSTLAACAVAAMAYCIGVDAERKRSDAEAASARGWSERNYRAGYQAGIAETQRGRDGKGRFTTKAKSA